MIGTIHPHSVDEALRQCLQMLWNEGKSHTAASAANQRPTLEWPGVFITEYQSPMRNVLFNPVRDANPFFHYLEAMWILAGRNDVGFLAELLPNMANYSDNGNGFHGAYGHRLRCWDYEGFDQIVDAIGILRDRPSTRQVVMSIWNPKRDLGSTSKDVPCNDLIMLKVRDGQLHITVNNRSNDAIWGAYGANAVQFSMLLGYMAAKLGLEVGTYTQVSNSMHVYIDTPYWIEFTENKRDVLYDGYSETAVQPNLFDIGIEHFDKDLDKFFMRYDAGELTYDVRYRSQAMIDASRIHGSYLAYKAGNMVLAMDFAGAVLAPDWGRACVEWLERRIEARNAKKAAGGDSAES